MSNVQHYTRNPAKLDLLSLTGGIYFEFYRTLSDFIKLDHHTVTQYEPGGTLACLVWALSVSPITSHGTSSSPASAVSDSVTESVYWVTSGSRWGCCSDILSCRGNAYMDSTWHFHICGKTVVILTLPFITFKVHFCVRIHFFFTSVYTCWSIITYPNFKYKLLNTILLIFQSLHWSEHLFILVALCVGKVWSPQDKHHINKHDMKRRKKCTIYSELNTALLSMKKNSTVFLYILD